MVRCKSTKVNSSILSIVDGIGNISSDESMGLLSYFKFFINFIGSPPLRIDKKPNGYTLIRWNNKLEGPTVWFK
jgi:hypothetical protein